MVFDSHLHMQDPHAELNREAIKERFSKAAIKLEACRVDEINAIYWPSIANKSYSCRKLGDELKDEYKDRIKLNTGMHFFLESDLWRDINLAEEANLDFIKVYELLFKKCEAASKEFLDSYIKKGFNKFQAHTFKLTNWELNKIEPYIESGVKFYLAHGASAVAESLRHGSIDVSHLKELKGFLFLGTTHYQNLTLDVNYLKEVLTNGLDDLLCFESDFNILSFDALDYSEYMQAVKNIAPADKQEKIFRKNAKLFTS